MQHILSGIGFENVRLKLLEGEFLNEEFSIIPCEWESFSTKSKNIIRKESNLLYFNTEEKCPIDEKISFWVALVLPIKKVYSTLLRKYYSIYDIECASLIIRDTPPNKMMFDVYYEALSTMLCHNFSNRKRIPRSQMEGIYPLKLTNTSKQTILSHFAPVPRYYFEEYAKTYKRVV